MSIEPITIPMSIETNEVTIESTFDAKIEVVEGGSITVESLSVNTNGTTTAPTGKAYSPVVVNVPASAVDSGTKNINTNGTHDVIGYASVAVSVPASAVDSGTKNITSNGDNQDVVGYAKVNVTVPNSYSASDEGKVVSSGALVSQTSDTVTTNDTYDTTLINSLTVNVSGGALPSRLINHMEITMATTATNANKLNVQLTPATNTAVMVLIDSIPDPPDSGYIALSWYKPFFSAGSGDGIGALLRANGTIGNDNSQCIFTKSTGILSLGGSYGHFIAGLKYNIFQFEMGE